MRKVRIIALSFQVPLPPPPPPSHATANSQQMKRTKGGTGGNASKGAKRKAKSKQQQQQGGKQQAGADPWLDFEGPPSQQHASLWTAADTTRQLPRQHSDSMAPTHHQGGQTGQQQIKRLAMNGSQPCLMFDNPMLSAAAGDSMHPGSSYHKVIAPPPPPPDLLGGTFF